MEVGEAIKLVVSPITLGVGFYFLAHCVRRERQRRVERAKYNEHMKQRLREMSEPVTVTGTCFHHARIGVCEGGVQECLHCHDFTPTVPPYQGTRGIVDAEVAEAEANLSRARSQ